MTADDAAQYLMLAAVTNIDAINRALDGTGLSLSLELTQDPADTSPYRRLKVGDRQLVPDGLTVCYIPQSDHAEHRMTGSIVDVGLSVRIVAYIRGVKDPETARKAKNAVAHALTDLYTMGAEAIVTQAGTVYDARVTDREYYTFNANETRMGQVLHVVSLTWSGVAYIPTTSAPAEGIATHVAPAVITPGERTATAAVITLVPEDAVVVGFSSRGNLNPIDITVSSNRRTISYTFPDEDYPLTADDWVTFAY